MNEQMKESIEILTFKTSLYFFRLTRKSGVQTISEGECPAPQTLTQRFNCLATCTI